MKKLLGIVCVVGLAGLIVACAPKASKDDCTAACQKNVDLNQPKKEAAADPAAAAEKDFAAKIEQINKDKEAALAAIDKELADKLAAVKEAKPPKKGKAKPDKKAEEAKAKLNAEYAAKKEAKAKEFADQIAALEKGKAEMVEQAKAAAAKAAEEEKAAREKAVAACAEGCVNAGVKKSVTDCQQKAASAEEFAKCVK
ncbi:MAG: hypothetical protein GYA21_00715 [Myxococcales bacterium]|nr:hypothetical protein [Myxococcales bacterium]